MAEWSLAGATQFLKSEEGAILNSIEAGTILSFELRGRTYRARVLWQVLPRWNNMAGTAGLPCSTKESASVEIIEVSTT